MERAWRCAGIGGGLLSESRVSDPSWGFCHLPVRGQDSEEEEVATALDSFFGSRLWGTTGTRASAAVVTYAAKEPAGLLLPGRLDVWNVMGNGCSPDTLTSGLLCRIMCTCDLIAAGVGGLCDIS